MPHLFVDISAHGLGHLAQTAPVLNSLYRLRPTVRLTIRSALPLKALRTRISAPFTHIDGCSDVVFAMHDATRIDYATSAQRFRDFHADWRARVAAEAAFLRELNPQRVLSDVAYLPLAGAAEAKIPALAMCSLNWGDIFAHVFAQETWAKPITAQIFAAYQQADCFFRLTPAMPMTALNNAVAMPPVASCGKAQRDQLGQMLGIPSRKKIILAAFGGFDKALAPESWPVLDDVHWLIPAQWQVARQDMSTLGALGVPNTPNTFSATHWSFSDLLASVDGVLTKPGYGTFVEAACSGVAVLYIPRQNWPEQDALTTWLAAHTRCQAISEQVLCSAQLGLTLQTLWQQPIPPRPLPKGNDALAHYLAQGLGA